MSEVVKIDGRYNLKVVFSEDSSSEITSDDKDMDNRAKCAVKTAIEKAKICNKPIARYDCENRKAYIEYTDGNRKYVE